MHLLVLVFVCMFFFGLFFALGLLFFCVFFFGGALINSL